MAQDKILEFLYNKRLEGNLYYSVATISTALKSEGSSIRHQLTKLLFYGFIENKTSQRIKVFSSGTPWRRNYRLKSKHISTVRRMIESVTTTEGVSSSLNVASENSITG